LYEEGTTLTTLEIESQNMLQDAIHVEEIRFKEIKDMTAL